jgi:hypothetical protein
MNARHYIAKSALLAIAVLAAPAFAASSGQQGETSLQPVRATAQPVPIGGYRAIQLLALETDLTPKQVQMVTKTVARHERFHLRAEQKVGQRFAQALGSERYARWAAGHAIPLHSPAVLEAARGMANVAANRAVVVAVNP